MAWNDIKQWFANMIPSADDFNRIEGNTLDNHERLNGHLSDGTRHAKTARFIVGTSTSGWTAANCDYLCDGTADHVEIQQALDALPEDGGEVVILDGTYNITASIKISKDNVSIRGNGNATVLKRMWDSSSDEGVITLTSVEGCRVENLQIDGNKTTYTSIYNYGIHLSSTNNTVTGNTCNNNYSGIYLSVSSNNTVTGNTCNNNNNNGIYLSSSSNNNTITGNTCNNNNNNGILLSTSSNNTVTGNTCNNNNNNGMHLRESSTDNAVTGNTCKNNDSNGIHLSSTNNTVTGNTCNNNFSGIFLSVSSKNTITGNTCNNNNTGIYLSSSTNNNTITGNTCNNNYSGIYLHSSSNNTITGNTCNDNNSNGIYLSSSSNNTVTGNTCIRGIGTPEDYTTDQYTIFLFATGNNYNLISSNNCMGKAVVISGGTGNSAWGNKFDNTDDLS